jgi:protein O-mannosyl-transferase
LYASMNQFDDAERQYLLAIRYGPRIPEACFELGLVWEKQSKRTEASKAYRDALRLKPDYAFAHNNLANLLAEDGILDKAIQHYQQAIAADPKLVAAHHNLAILLRRTGDLNGAIQHLRSAVELEPAHADTRLELGQALMVADRYAEAIATFRGGLQLQSNHNALENALAWLLATCPDPQLRDGPDAVQISERLVQATAHTRPDVLDTLAAAYAEVGRFQDAVRTAKEALTLAQTSADSNVVAAIEAHLRLYERQQPVRLISP